MGSRMIHLCVAKAILKRIPLKEELFILGNLAPDAYNPQNVGYAHTHFRIPEETMEFINHAASECVKAIHVQGAKESGDIRENPNH